MKEKTKIPSQQYPSLLINDGLGMTIPPTNTITQFVNEPCRRL